MDNEATASRIAIPISHRALAGKNADDSTSSRHTLPTSETSSCLPPPSSSAVLAGCMYSSLAYGSARMATHATRSLA